MPTSADVDAWLKQRATPKPSLSDEDIDAWLAAKTTPPITPPPYDYLADLPEPEAFAQSEEGQRNIAAFQSSLAENIRALLHPRLADTAALLAGGPALGPIIPRIIDASRTGNVLPVISPEAENVRRVLTAQTPEEYQSGMVPLLIEGAGFAVPGLRGALRGARVPPTPLKPPPVPEWATRPPALTIPMDPYAPSAQQAEALSAAIAKANQTKIERALAAQAQRQTQPGAPVEEPIVGPAPEPWNPLAAAAQQAEGARQMALLRQQAELERRITGSVSIPTQRQINQLNQELQRGIPEAPERRFVIPPTEGAPNATQIQSTGTVPQLEVRPSVGKKAPLRRKAGRVAGAGKSAAGVIPSPKPITAQLPTQPGQPAVPPAVAPPVGGAAAPPPVPGWEKPPVIPRPRAKALQAARDIEAKAPGTARKVVKKVLNRNVALDDLEHGLLQVELENADAAYESAINAVNSTVDKSPQQAAAVAHFNDAMTRLSEATDAYYKSGTATARGLGFRAGTQQFSLARMMREMQAANAGRPLEGHPEIIDRVRELSGKLTDNQQRMTAAHELRQRMGAIMKEYAKERAASAGAKAGSSAQSTASFLSRKAVEAKARIAQRRAEGRLYAGVDPEALLDHVIVGADLLARGVTTFSQWSGQMIAAIGENIRPFLKDIYDRSRRMLESTMQTDKRLAAYKKRKRASIEALQKKIDAGDFTKPEKTKLALDKEALDLQQEYDNLRNQWKKELRIRQKASMPGWRRLSDTIVEALRAEKLTGLGTIGKIVTAAMQRPITTAAEEVAGKVSTAIPFVRRIAEGAPTERPSFSSLRHYPGAVVKGIKEAPEVLSGAHEPPEYSGRGPSVLQYPGRSHGALKNPIRKAEEAVGMDRALQWAEKEGLDPNSPEVMAQLHEFAKQRGLRGIWMNDNFASRAFRQILSMLERNLGAPGFVASRIARILLPIIRVPTNVAIELGRYHFGLPNAAVRVGHAIKVGLDNVTPAQKDLIMMNLKKGQVGAGLFALGYFLHDNFGGFYNEETSKAKERKTGLKPLEAKIWKKPVPVLGHGIPSWASHSAPMLIMHAGATFHDIMETKHGTIFHSERAVLRGILENIPFMNELGKVDKAIMGAAPEAQRVIGGWIKGNVSPVLIQEIARWTDTHDKNGHPIKRYPRNIYQEVEMGIPPIPGAPSWIPSRKNVPRYPRP